MLCHDQREAEDNQHVLSDYPILTLPSCDVSLDKLLQKTLLLHG